MKRNLLKFSLIVIGLFLIDAFPSPLIELSYTFNNKTPTYPILTRYSSKVFLKGNQSDGTWRAVNNFCTSEHSGTHMDAPYHFVEHGKTIDLIPYEKLYRISGIKVNVVEKVKLDQNYAITAQDMEDWVATNGPLPDGVVVLFQTDWSKKVDDLDAYYGTNKNGSLSFPGIGEDASQWLVNYGNKTGQKRGVLGVGLDVLSLDVGQAIGRPAHVTLLSHEIYGLENLKDLDKLPASNFTLTMLPIKIGKGTGGPTRVLAELGGVSLFDARA